MMLKWIELRILCCLKNLKTQDKQLLLLVNVSEMVARLQHEIKLGGKI
jgi:hypothetical protein